MLHRRRRGAALLVLALLTSAARSKKRRYAPTNHAPTVVANAARSGPSCGPGSSCPARPSDRAPAHRLGAATEAQRAEAQRAEAHARRAVFLATSGGDLREAIAAMDRALAIEPRDAANHDRRATLFANLGGDPREVLGNPSTVPRVSKPAPRAVPRSPRLPSDLQYLAGLDRAIALDPLRIATAHMNRGSALAHAAAYARQPWPGAEATAAFEAALAIGLGRSWCLADSNCSAMRRVPALAKWQPVCVCVLLLRWQTRRSQKRGPTKPRRSRNSVVLRPKCSDLTILPSPCGRPSQAPTTAAAVPWSRSAATGTRALPRSPPRQFLILGAHSA